MAKSYCEHSNNWMNFVHVGNFSVTKNISNIVSWLIDSVSVGVSKKWMSWSLHDIYLVHIINSCIFDTLFFYLKTLERRTQCAKTQTVSWKVDGMLHRRSWSHCLVLEQQASPVSHFVDKDAQSHSRGQFFTVKCCLSRRRVKKKKTHNTFSLIFSLLLLDFQTSEVPLVWNAVI